MPLCELVKNRLTELIGPAWKRKRYIVAVSGGMDSVALLHAVQSLLPKANLTVAHFDHRVRKSSQKDARFVEELSRKLGLQFVLAKRVGEGTSETSLRTERLDFFRSLRRESQAHYILTAHHADDQLETLLMRLIRGTGLKGLRGILPMNGPFVRPLLGVSRSNIREYVTTHAIDYRTDETNSDPKFLRNAVRLRLIPEIYAMTHSHGQPETLLRRIAGLTEEVKETEAFIVSQARHFLQKEAVQTPFFTRIAHEAFISRSPLFQSHLLRELCPLETQKLTRKKIREILQAIARKTSHSISKQLTVSVSMGMIYFIQENQLAKLKQLQTPERNHENFHFSEIGLKLRVTRQDVVGRYSQKGDRVRHRRKLKRYFWELRIPEPERALIPIIAEKTSGEVIWHLGSQSKDVQVVENSFPFSKLSSTFH